MIEEYLLYYGLLTHDPAWLDMSATIYRESATIYRAHSLEAVRSHAAEHYPSAPKVKP